MKGGKEKKAGKNFGMESTVVKERRVASSLFAVYWAVTLLMSGVHMGLLILMMTIGSHAVIMILVLVAYWGMVSAVLTLYTRKRMRDTYAEPLHRMAEATKSVAGGDFSIYVPPIHTSDKLDYVDAMLSDFNKMVEELGSIETLKTDFFSNVSHEIKTPLAIIQNNAEVLRADELSEKQRGCADAIFGASKRLSDLITNILKLDKLEKQTILPETTSYDLCAQLAECALNFEQVWEDKGLEFDADMEDRVMITADPSLMELVWNNLFSNAVKFTESGGRILLTEESDEKEVRVMVRDTGCGMTEETKKHIFDRFYQGDTSHATAGNGLGLALALRVLQLNDFQIEVESELGKGSAFTVTIPKTKNAGGYWKMSENVKTVDTFDYLKITVDEDMLSQYMDGYGSFGWCADENVSAEKSMGKATLHLKRDRHIMNKVELTRLQRHYEACMGEIKVLEDSKNSVPTAIFLGCGLAGCVFMAGSVFAVTATPPMIWLCVVLGLPGFILWGLSWIGYKRVKAWRIRKVAPLIEAKYEEAYEVCEKAGRLL